MNTMRFFDRYLADYRHYKNYWNYEDGCVLLGCRQLFAATGEEQYAAFVLAYLDAFVRDDGTIRQFPGMRNLDSFNTGKLLPFAAGLTRERKYRLAMDFLMRELSCQPRTRAGSFWHKSIYPGQIWLDGLYMALPFYMEYDTLYGGCGRYDDIFRQLRTVRARMFDEKKQLYYHAYDEMRHQPWADAVTGTSKSFWLRAIGWYLMALVDLLDIMSPEAAELYSFCVGLLQEALRGLLRYRDARTGLFYQLVDKPALAGNYPETSGSVMVSYALLKGCRLGVLEEAEFLDAGLSLLGTIEAQKLVTDGDRTHLTGICRMAGLGPGAARDGSAAYYLSEQIVSDDPKGVGPLMMACAQRLLCCPKEVKP